MNPQRLIAVAPNGARKTRTDHPALPITPQEIAEEAASCLEAGAAMLHLHVRDEGGYHSLDPGRYREAIEAVRQVTQDNLIIQITTEGVGMYGADTQRAVVQELKPEACSIALRELCPDDTDRTVASFIEFLSWCASFGISTQIILYDAEDVDRLNRIKRSPFFPIERLFVLLVLGRYTNAATNSEGQLIEMLGRIQGPDINWMTCAFGPPQTRLVTAGAALGGHVRIGFENGTELPGGGLACSNAELVKASKRALKDIGLAPMSADEARASVIR